MTLEFILYSSTAGQTLSERDLWDILYRSVRNNEQEGITGFLHYDQGHFLQYLEGPSEVLQWWVDKMSDDPRNAEMKVIAMGPLKKRLFPDWDMGLIDPQSLPSQGLLFGRGWTKAIHELEPESILAAIARHSGSVSRLNFGAGPHAEAFFPDRVVEEEIAAAQKKGPRKTGEGSGRSYMPRWL